MERFAEKSSLSMAPMLRDQKLAERESNHPRDRVVAVSRFCETINSEAVIDTVFFFFLCYTKEFVDESVRIETIFDNLDAVEKVISGNAFPTSCRSLAVRTAESDLFADDRRSSRYKTLPS